MTRTTTSTTSHDQRTHRATAIWGGVVIAGTVLVAMVWAVWGFSWPPTAEVVLEEEPKRAAVEH